MHNVNTCNHDYSIKKQLLTDQFIWNERHNKIFGAESGEWCLKEELLDDEGQMELGLVAGGPWAVPKLSSNNYGLLKGRKRAKREGKTNDGEANKSWAKGPGNGAKTPPPKPPSSASRSTLFYCVQEHTHPRVIP